MSSDIKQCIAITELETRCTRKAELNSEYCWQHHKISNKIELELIPAISNTILSEYIEYEELKELNNQFEGLNINPDRIRIEEGYINVEEDDEEEPSEVKYENTYIDNILRIEKEWYLENKNQINIIARSNLNGEIDGLQEKWYLNGNKEFEINYKNGKKDGVSKRWNKNRNLESVENYKNGELDGQSIEYFPNGKTIKCILNYKDSELDGTQEYFDSYGDLESIKNYKNDKLDGESIEYFLDGKTIKSISNYKNGIQSGIQKYYDLYGTLIEIKDYVPEKYVQITDVKTGKSTIYTWKTYFKEY